MKKVIILRSNGFVETKKEKSITIKDIVNAKYFLIPVSANNDAFAIVTPTEYLLFDKAIVKYRLCMFFSEDDYDDVGFAEMELVECEIASMCDLIGLLNSIDRVSIVNTMLNPDEISDYGHSVGVTFFSIQLLNKKGKTIYHTTYQLSHSIGPVFDPYQAVKHFKDIYKNTLISSWFTKQQHLYLYTKNESVKWKIDRDMTIYDRIGLMLQDTNTIVFVSPYHYPKLIKHRSMECLLCIYYEKNAFIKEMNELIREGKTIEERRDLMGQAEDVYFEDYKLFSLNARPSDRFVEILAHAEFITSVLYLAYSELYGNTVKDNRYDFDIIISLKLAETYFNERHLQLTVSRQNTLPLIDVLDYLSF